MGDCHDERDSLSIARSQPMPPSAQQVTALLSRARYAHQFREPVYVTPDEMKALDTTDTYALLPCTLFGVQVAVNPRRAEAQIADAIAHPAPPMDWEVGAERNAMDGFGPAYPGATAGA